MAQQTLEEVAESRYGTDMDSIRGSKIYDLNADVKRGFIAGAKWQQEHGQEVGHSVQVDVIDLIQFLSMNQEFNGYGSVSKETAKHFLEQFKNNQ
jgi:hypothetical protein